MPAAKRNVAAKKPAKASKPRQSAAKPRKARRTAYELYNDLQLKRDALQSKHEEKIASLDARIAKLTEKHQNRIEIDRLKQAYSDDELAAKLEEVRSQLTLLRQARKSKQTA